MTGSDPARFDRRQAHQWLAYGFGSGLLPWAPGTWGTLAAVPLYLLLAGLPIGLYLALVALLFLIGIWACDRTGRDLGVPDHGAIVWDEIVGYLVAMAGLPLHWGWVLAGFALFRVFDILKPWPIGWMDRHVSGGAGVMLDDVVAGVFTLAVLHLVSALLG